MSKDKYHYIYEDSSLDIQIATMDEPERELFGDYVEKIRHFEELFKLFKIFKNNHDLLFEKFDLQANDTVVFSENFELEDDDLEILINMYTINFLASGNTLTESVEVYIETCLGEAAFEEFRQKVSGKIYDEHLPYKWLRYLRNYSQHGHIPVEVEMRRACFNLDDIIFKPHTKKLNKPVRREMIDIRKSILKETGGKPLIVYTITIVEMTLYIIKIYFEFLNYIKEDLKKAYEEVQSVIISNPDIICEGLVFYDQDEIFSHCFDPSDNTITRFSEVKKEVRKQLKSQENEVTKLKRGLKKTK